MVVKACMEMGKGEPPLMHMEFCGRIRQSKGFHHGSVVRICLPMQETQEMQI